MSDIEAIAHATYIADQRGAPLPHDGRNLAGVNGDVLAWTCPQCKTVINELRPDEAPPCTVDWRWPLHKRRYMDMVHQVLWLHQGTP